MGEIVKCKRCNEYEQQGQMMWLNGQSMCRDCYISDWESKNKKECPWKNNKSRPVKQEHNLQELKS